MSIILFRIEIIKFLILNLLCLCDCLDEQLQWGDGLPTLPPQHYVDTVRKNFLNSTTCPSIKNIPCHIWITSRYFSKSHVPGHVKALVSRNHGWHAHLIGDEKMNLFMQTVFNGTKVLWAFEAINPSLGAARADIWRLAVLWTYGGAYIDVDADISSPFEKFIDENDAFLFGTEGNPIGNCYKPEFHLNASVTNAIPKWFKHKTILQWLFISEPGHPFLTRSLTNMAELVRLEYDKKSVIGTPLHGEDRFLAIICCTGPVLFASSVLEVINETADKVSYRYIGKDFLDFGGNFKAGGFNDETPHYIKLMNKESQSFLRSYGN